MVYVVLLYLWTWFSVSRSSISWWKLKRHRPLNTQLRKVLNYERVRSGSNSSQPQVIFPHFPSMENHCTFFGLSDFVFCRQHASPYLHILWIVSPSLIFAKEKLLRNVDGRLLILFKHIHTFNTLFSWCYESFFPILMHGWLPITLYGNLIILSRCTAQRCNKSKRLTWNCYVNANPCRWRPQLICPNINNKCSINSMYINRRM